jgi:hypothetical protein
MQSASESATQRLYKAVIVLASGQGVVQERLAHAYVSYLADLNTTQLPAGLRDECDTIRNALRAMHPEGGKLDGADPERCMELARRIIIVYDAIIK